MPAVQHQYQATSAVTEASLYHWHRRPVVELQARNRSVYLGHIQRSVASAKREVENLELIGNELMDNMRAYN